MSTTPQVCRRAGSAGPLGGAFVTQGTISALAPRMGARECTESIAGLSAGRFDRKVCDNRKACDQG